MLTKSIELNLTPEELADVFAGFDNDDQAKFFNRVGEIAKAWSGAGWCQQSSHIAQSGDLSDIGRETIRTLAGHVGEAA